MTKRLFNIKTILKRVLLFIGLLFFVWYIFALPDPLFSDPTATVVYDRSNKLLGARIADDGQWRFPANDSVPDKFTTCILAFEDRGFYTHFGVSPKAIARAFIQNIKAGRVVSGGSTISMQVIRLSRKGQARTVFEKVLEIILATRMEWRYSKAEILRIYATYAPFGGNVVGLDAAAWRYFSKPANKLSWAQAAGLAVLPNAPALVRPGKNTERLEAKRNKLLHYLFTTGEISKLDYKLALAEPLPGRPHALPQLAPHLIQRAEKDGFKGKILHTTIDAYFQQHINTIVKQFGRQYAKNEVNNLAVLVVDAETGDVVSYCGNRDEGEAHANDMVITPRSSGSILKPFLYAMMIQDGWMTPDRLVPDYPVQYKGFSPSNYDKKYYGAIPASRALARSLNVPAVLMLKEYSVDKFYKNMQDMGMHTLRGGGGRYGLTLILGGAETTMWDLANIYRKLNRRLADFPREVGVANIHYHKISPEADSSEIGIDAAPVWFTFEAMSKVVRPEEEQNWEQFHSTRKVAWKTGTSFGFRDAWAVGVTPGYVITVWAGNADGEGRPRLTGINNAAPVLFSILDVLNLGSWFEFPYDQTTEVAICRHSRHRAGAYCFDVDTVAVPNQSLNTLPCPYCRQVMLDKTRQYRVNSFCVQTDEIVWDSMFVLPPVMSWYFNLKNADYKPLPPIRNDCLDGVQEKPIRLIYPKTQSVIYLPRDFDRKKQHVVLKAAHIDPGAIIYWHIDKEFIGTTTHRHFMDVSPTPGKHLLTLIDQNGETFARWITVVSR